MLIVYHKITTVWRSEKINNQMLRERTENTCGVLHWNKPPSKCCTHKIKKAVKPKTGLWTHIFGKIIGGINFGKDTNIGANPVILSDLPPDTTAVGMYTNKLKFTKAQEND